MASSANVPRNRTLHWCCSKCEAFFAKIADYPAQISIKTRPEEMPFYDIEDLELSALAGCHLCTLIKTELGREKIEELHEQLEQDPSLHNQQLEAVVWVSRRGVAPDTPIDGPRLWLQEARLRPAFASKETLAEFRYESIVTEREERA